MRFTKMHGIGNDYVYVNGFSETVAAPEKLAIAVSDRHYGIGSDGLILILPSDKADVRMRMFNADGSESEMCGNGVRCVAKYSWDHGLARHNPMKVETGRGVLSIKLQLDSNDKVELATVDMGEPILELPKVPVDTAAVKAAGTHAFTVAGYELPMTFVSMGNPHATIFVEEVQSVDLEKVGLMLEKHLAFPRRINVHFVQVVSPAEVIMRTWERGSGITWACGTGACAVAVSGILTGRTARKLLAHLPGGDLHLEWREADNHVYMTGPATEVFSGEWNAL